ncbi:uncharacterized protein LOC125370436 [Ricinus communis]|uniref:uncharacterized protein LOC125370436 n=1 Tax=Ricinus communis TaxID=3988 RepID=UPI00201A24FA|nr:uncharacterized protein LOC125370436 [Ricinus communis]
MSGRDGEPSGSKPIIIQSEGAFNAGITLTESNYDVWSQLMEMHIAEREKLSYIRGKTKPPAESEDGYEKWYAENQKELDHRDKVVMKDPDDVVAYKKPIERLRVHIFLAGLDDHFEQVRGEILRQESTLGLEESYALIR